MFPPSYFGPVLVPPPPPPDPGTPTEAREDRILEHVAAALAASGAFEGVIIGRPDLGRGPISGRAATTQAWVYHESSEPQAEEMVGGLGPTRAVEVEFRLAVEARSGDEMVAFRMAARMLAAAEVALSAPPPPGLHRDGSVRLGPRSRANNVEPPRLRYLVPVWCEYDVPGPRGWATVDRDYLEAPRP